jgi:prepilin-type processing-associated H-X9-DG protein
VSAAAAKIPSGAPVLFVDGHPAHLRTAESFGWHTPLADEADGGWIRRVEPPLRGLG